MQFGLFTLFDFFPDRQNESAYYQDALDLMIYAGGGCPREHMLNL
jgi:hypothetical protein